MVVLKGRRPDLDAEKQDYDDSDSDDDTDYTTEQSSRLLQSNVKVRLLNLVEFISINQYWSREYSLTFDPSFCHFNSQRKENSQPKLLQASRG